MPSLTANILYDTYERSVIQFIWGGGSNVAAYGLTGSVLASSLTGYDSTLPTGSTAVNINVSKVYWSLPQGSTATAIELAWGSSGSVTGVPFLYLNGNGRANFVADGMYLRNTDTSANRRNSVQFRNVASMNTNDTMTLIVELDKNGGYIRQM